MKIVFEFLSVVLTIVLSLAIASCGDGENGNETECGAGTIRVGSQCLPQCENATEYWNGTACAPVPECAEGTQFNAVTGDCEPRCKTAEEYWDGTACVPLIVCAEGTHLEEIGCVPNRLPTPDVREGSDGKEVFFDLPAEGESISLGGVIDTPEKNFAGVQIPDWDYFAFQTDTGNLYLRLLATSEGAARPAFEVFGITPESYSLPSEYWDVIYQRIALNPNGLDTVHELYLPRPGIYLISVTDYNHLEEKYFPPNWQTVPVGGPEYTYYVEVERLTRPEPIVISPQNQLPGNFDEGKVSFYSLSGLAPDKIMNISTTGIVDGLVNDIMPVLSVFDSEWNFIGERYTFSVGEAASWLCLSDYNYNIVVDNLLTVGPNRKYAIGVNEVAPKTYADGHAIPLAAYVSHVYVFDQLQHETLASYVESRRYDGTLMVTIYDSFGKLLKLGASYYVTAYDTILPSLLYQYAKEDSRLLVEIKVLEGYESEYDFYYDTVPETTLASGVNQDISVHELVSAYGDAFYDIGLGQFDANADSFVFITGFNSTPDLVSPKHYLLDSDFCPIQLTESLIWNVSPLSAYIPADGRFLHMVSDQEQQNLAGTTYGLTLSTVVPKADVGTPTGDNPIITVTDPIDPESLASVTFFSVTEGGLYKVTAETPEGSTLVPDVRVLSFVNSYNCSDYFFDPNGGTVIQTEKGYPFGDVVATNLFPVPYSGKMALLILDKSGTATGLVTDVFNVRIEHIAPPPNENCDSPMLLEIPDEGGNVVVTGYTSTGQDDYQGNCVLVPYAGGIDVVYELHIVGDRVTPAHVVVETLACEGQFDTVLYIRTTCDNPYSEVACNNQRPPGGTDLSLIDTTLDPGTYYIILDGDKEGDDGNYSLSVTVEFPE